MVTQSEGLMDTMSACCNVDGQAEHSWKNVMVESYLVSSILSYLSRAKSLLGLSIEPN